MLGFLKMRWLGTFLAVVGLSSWVWADTMEMITYYPTETDMQDLDVGMLNTDQLGIGTDSLNSDTLLKIVGDDDDVNNILFLPGIDNGGNGDTEIRIGIGTDVPSHMMHLVRRSETPGQAALGVQQNGDATGAVYAGYFITDGTATENIGGRFGALNGTSNAAIWIPPTHGGVSIGFGDIINGITNGGTPPNGGMIVAGNVGIGTNDPQVALHVDGRIFSSALGGNGDVNGDNQLSPIDSLNIINSINSGVPLTPDKAVRADVTNDGQVTSADLREIVNVLNARGSGPVMSTAERRIAATSLSNALNAGAAGNVAVGASTATPLPGQSPQNNQIDGNLSANDVYIRSTNQWMSQGGSQPDYDSGWVSDNRWSSHQTVFNHNLGVFPSRITIWFASSNNPSTVYPVQWSWYYSSSGNPVTIEMSTSSVRMNIWSGTYLHGHWNGSNSRWTFHNSGYWRVLAWR